MKNRSIVSLSFFLVSLSACSGSSPEASPGDSAEAIASAECSPSRAVGAVNVYEKALHDAIAYSEGTKGRGKDGYNVGFDYKIFASCAKHPNIDTCSGRLCSTAAGRYQFLKKTWTSVASAIGATDFEPDSQERGAAYLVTRVHRATVPSTRALTAPEFSSVLKKLNREWASLPGSPFGQPTRSTSELWSAYKSALSSAGSSVAPDLGGVDSGVAAQCATDADCNPNGDEGLLCVNGVCGADDAGASRSGSSGSPTASACVTDDDCDANMFCVDGACAE